MRGQGITWNGTECYGIVIRLTTKVFGSGFGLSKVLTEVLQARCRSTRRVYPLHGYTPLPDTLN